MAGGAPLRVLIVEDESIVAMMVEDVVLDLGYQVAAVTGRVEQALTLIGSLDFDIAVLDVNLHGQMSYPIADALRTRGKPFVFATGYGVTGLRDEWRDRPVLQKPFEPEALAGALARALQQA